MSPDNFIDEFKQWFQDRLSSPYFATSAFVLAVRYKTLIISLFNFEETKTVEQRIVWLNKVVNHITFNFWIYKGSGFCPAIVYSLIWGLVIMISFKILGRIGEVFYHKANKYSIFLVNKLKPAEWIEYYKYEKAVKKSDKLIAQYNAKEIEYERIDLENKALLNDESVKILKIEELNNVIVTQNAEINMSNNQIAELKEQNEKLKIQNQTVGRYLDVMNKEKDDAFQKNSEIANTVASQIRKEYETKKIIHEESVGNRVKEVSELHSKVLEVKNNFIIEKIFVDGINLLIEFNQNNFEIMIRVSRESDFWEIELFPKEENSRANFEKLIKRSDFIAFPLNSFTIHSGRLGGEVIDEIGSVRNIFNLLFIIISRIDEFLFKPGEI